MTLIEKYLWTAKKIQEESWTMPEQVLFYELIRKWNSVGRKCIFYETDKEIQDNIHLTRPTIRKARKGLIEKGHIQFAPRWKDSSEYKFGKEA